MIFKYLNVGILNSIVGFLIIIACIKFFNINYHLSYFIGYAIGLIISFILNKRYTFKNKSKWHSLVLPFIVIFIFSYLISHFILIFLVEKTQLNINIAILISMVLYTAISYLMNKKLFLNKNTI
jgi:putative flippase GtrA